MAKKNDQMNNNNPNHNAKNAVTSKVLIPNPNQNPLQSPSQNSVNPMQQGKNCKDNGAR